METIIIGQGYNLSKDSSVGKELIELFDSHRYNSFICLVAFASFAGVSALTSKIFEAKAAGVDVKIILGVDQKGTSKEALEEVLSWGIDAKIYHTSDINIFHPKIYLFENEDIFSLIVGSNNLTVPGLVQNVECSLMIKDIKSNPVLQAFYDYWGGILNGTEINLYPLTQNLIDKLYEDKVITIESERNEKFDNGYDEVTTSNKNLKFKKAGIQPLPDGFVPKRNKRKVKTCIINRKGNKQKELIGIDSEILLAEIGAGPRWKQINFPISIFEKFFGARRGDNTYTIDLTNIAKDGTLGEVETRQAVTVKSNNFRFEINCAETAMTYPGKSNRPIGLFIKSRDSKFLYQILMPYYPAYAKIKQYLDIEARPGRNGELKRIIVDSEAIHALYPELII